MAEPLETFLQHIRDLRPDRSMPIQPRAVREALRTAREPHWTADERKQIYIALKRASVGDATIVRLIQARLDGLERPPVVSSPASRRARLVPPRRLPGRQSVLNWRPWWSGDLEERYWLEITDRDSVGDDLQGYRLDEGLRTSQAYTLAASHMLLGDTVYHFDLRVGAICLKSSVGGKCDLEDEGAPEEDYWIVTLSGQQKVQPPVTRATIAKREDQIYSVLEDIRTRHPSPTYLPFTMVRGQLRIRQTYLTKMPKRVAEVLGLR